MVKSAKAAYEQYPTIVNKLKESGLTYKNTMKEYARMNTIYCHDIITEYKISLHFIAICVM